MSESTTGISDVLVPLRLGGLIGRFSTGTECLNLATLSVSSPWCHTVTLELMFVLVMAIVIVVWPLGGSIFFAKTSVA